jgi:uncharacterized protein YaiE (UPF0345 family)
MFKLRKYHGDRVQSLTYDGDDKSFSVGILAPGEYEFGAIKKEVITVTSGEISAWVEGWDNWKTYKTGETFEVGAHKNFKQKVTDVSSYICFYE